MRRWPWFMKMIEMIVISAIADEEHEPEDVEAILLAGLNRLGHVGGIAQHDADEDDQRDAVADALVGNLLAEPHEETALPDTNAITA